MIRHLHQRWLAWRIRALERHVHQIVRESNEMRNCGCSQYDHGLMCEAWRHYRDRLTAARQRMAVDYIVCNNGVFSGTPSGVSAGKQGYTPTEEV